MSGAPPKDPNAPEREKLPTEVKFDKAVYGGISYAAQAGTGILLTYWLKYGSGKPHFEKAAKWLGPKIFRNRSIEEATKEISSPLMVSTMIMVGNTFLVPVKMLENHKPEIVRRWHEEHVKKKQSSDTPYTPEELAHQQECLRQLDAAPKQTWKSLLGGRAFGLAAVYSVLFGLGNARNEAAENYSAKVILKGLDKVGAKGLAKNKTLERYIHVGFLDVFYSMVSAGGLYVYSHYVNPPKRHKNEGLLPDMVIGPTPATPAINALQTESQKYEEQIDLDSKQNQSANQFTAKIPPRKPESEITPKRALRLDQPENFKKKPLQKATSAEPAERSLS